MKLRILEEWTGYMGIDSTALERESVLLIPGKKSESGRVSVFYFENKIVLIFDPALESIVRNFEKLSEFSVEKIPALSGGSLRRGRKTSIKYLNPSNFVPYDPPDEFIVRRLNLGDRTAFYNFRSHCTREDLAEGYTLFALAVGLVGSTPVLPLVCRKAEQQTGSVYACLQALSYAGALALLLVDILHLSAASYVPFIYFQF